MWHCVDVGWNISALFLFCSFGLIISKKITEYNNLVTEYNILAGKTKIMIDEYNSQIRLLNQCIAGTQ